MDLTAQDIIEMARAGENSNVEFKECGKTFPKEAWSSYSAFANTRGGWIILGVKEHRDRQLPDKFEIVGVNEPAKIIQEFGSQLDNSQKVSRNILTNNDLYTIDINDKKVIVIHIPEADYRRKPIYLHGDKVAHSYKRTQQGDAHLTDEELAIMLRDADTSDSDLALMENYSIDDIDPETLRKYRQSFNIMNPGHVFSDKTDKEFLVHMGAYIKDRSTNKEGLTLAGLLMFGKGLSIRERFPQLRMDYLDLSNVPKCSGLKWNERLTYDGRWENNLYNFITYVMSKITFGIPAPGIVKGMVRDDDSLILKAIREAVTNSIIHADLRIEGVLRIDKRENSIIIRNPGILKLSKDKIYDGNHTKARNPKIQDMLRMIGYGDNIGSGFPLILEAWKEESWIKPRLDEDRELHEVSLTLRMSSLYAPEVISKINDLYGERFKTLAADEKECLVLIISESAKTNSDLQSQTGKNSWEINRILSSLVAAGYITSNPNGRWTTYSTNFDFSKETPLNLINNDNKDIVKEIDLSKISDLQKTILDNITKQPSITISKLAEIADVSSKVIIYQRIKMAKFGIKIIHNGSTKKGYWTISYDPQTK